MKSAIDSAMICSKSFILGFIENKKVYNPPIWYCME